MPTTMEQKEASLQAKIAEYEKQIESMSSEIAKLNAESTEAEKTIEPHVEEEYAALVNEFNESTKPFAEQEVNTAKKAELQRVKEDLSSRTGEYSNMGKQTKQKVEEYLDYEKSLCDETNAFKEDEKQSVQLEANEKVYTVSELPAQLNNDIAELKELSNAALYDRANELANDPSSNSEGQYEHLKNNSTLLDKIMG